MATKYQDIFVVFKDNITDPDLLAFSQELHDEILTAYLTRAVSKCERICKLNDVDLTDRNDATMEFSTDLPNDVIDILIEWMIVFWLRPYLNNLEMLHNTLNTKDFTFFSPANLLKKISDFYENARQHARSLMNEYSYVHADMSVLKP